MPRRPWPHRPPQPRDARGGGGCPGCGRSRGWRGPSRGCRRTRPSRRLHPGARSGGSRAARSESQAPATTTTGSARGLRTGTSGGVTPSSPAQAHRHGAPQGGPGTTIMTASSATCVASPWQGLRTAGSSCREPVEDASRRRTSAIAPGEPTARSQPLSMRRASTSPLGIVTIRPPQRHRRLAFSARSNAVRRQVPQTATSPGLGPWSRVLTRSSRQQASDRRTFRIHAPSAGGA